MTKVNNCLRLINRARHRTVSVAIMAGIAALATNTNLSAGENANSTKAADLKLTPGRNHTGTRVRVQGGGMQTRIEGGEMVLTGFHGRLAGGKVEMRGRVNPTGGDSERQHMNVNVANVAVDQILSLLAPAALRPVISGLQLSGTVAGAWQGVGLDTISTTLTGDFDFALAPGVITERALLEKIANATGITDLTKISFDTAHVAGTATDGNIQLSELRITGPDVQLVGSGAIDLQTEQMNLSFEGNVSQEIAQKSAFFQVKNILNSFKNNTAPAANAQLVQLPSFELVGSMRSPEVRFSGKQVASAASPTQPVEASVAKPVAATNGKSDRASAYARQLARLGAALQ
ncbi:MAG: AsmA-like C-terminal region-containing protein [Candidatus Sumerlaeaceae bacterium]